CVARWGGDEFIGFIDAPGDAEETLRCLLESVRDLDNHVTISIGATRINPEDDMDAILMRVDDGMYRSKAEGRDRITYV
ncbi:MAG: diguanylate cyclase domain-containing protein, partial [Bilophila wadsworthia]